MIKGNQSQRFHIASKLFSGTCKRFKVRLHQSQWTLTIS